MEQKINIGEITIAEYNLLMKQLAAGQLGECIDLFMKFRQFGVEAQQKNQVNNLPPPIL